MDIIDFLIAYVVGLGFYGLYFPALIVWMRIRKRVPPVLLLTLARWVVFPGLLLVVVIGVFRWESQRCIVALAFDYLQTLVRMLQVIQGKKTSDRETLQALFVAAHADHVAPGTQIPLGRSFDAGEVIRKPRSSSARQVPAQGQRAKEADK